MAGTTVILRVSSLVTAADDDGELSYHWSSFHWGSVGERELKIFNTKRRKALPVHISAEAMLAMGEEDETTRCNS